MNIKRWVLVAAIVLLAVGYCGYRIIAPRFVEPAQVVVCIDPGHPSERNSGMAKKHGVTETDINWEVALKLEQLLAQDPHIKVIKTRQEQYTYTPNYQRALSANQEHASLAIHLHCDAGPSRGYTIYYPDEMGNYQGLCGPSDIVRSESKKAAECIQSAMACDLEGYLRDRGTRGESRIHNGSRRGPLTTSLFSLIPTVTVEMVFLTNRHDVAFIKTEDGQWKMATALQKGILQYLKPKLDPLREQHSSVEPAHQPGGE